MNFSLDFGTEKVRGMGGSSYVEKKDDYTAIGYDKYDIIFNNKEVPENLDVKLNSKTISLFDKNYIQTGKVKGNWSVDLKLEKLPSNVYKPDGIVEKNGVFVKIDRINSDEAETQIDISLSNSLNLHSAVYNIAGFNLYDENNNLIETFSGSLSSTIEKNIIKFSTIKPLSKGEYTLKLLVFKDGFLGYDEKGNISYLEDINSEKYKNAPAEISGEIIFEIK